MWVNQNEILFNDEWKSGGRTREVFNFSFLTKYDGFGIDWLNCWLELLPCIPTIDLVYFFLQRNTSLSPLALLKPFIYIRFRYRKTNKSSQIYK